MKKKKKKDFIKTCGFNRRFFRQVRIDPKLVKLHKSKKIFNDFLCILTKIKNPKNFLKKVLTNPNQRVIISM